MDSDLTLSIELVHKAQGGDGGALERLFDRYYARVRRIVRLRMGRDLRRSVDSGDILQDTFFAAIRSFETFEVRDEASLINWLSKLAERQILTAAARYGAGKRDKKREVLLSEAGSDGEESVPFELEASTHAPLENLSEAEQTTIVENCIHELPDDVRELIILRDYAGASWETVAHDTGRPSAAAARMMHARALIELGKRVRRKGLS